MTKVFRAQIAQVPEVYLEDMTAKSRVVPNHLADLTEVFAEVQKNTRLKPIF